MMVMLGLMLVAAIFPMWMSNTATTAMMITLVVPMLAQIPPGDATQGVSTIRALRSQHRRHGHAYRLATQRRRRRLFAQRQPRNQLSTMNADRGAFNERLTAGVMALAVGDIQTVYFGAATGAD